MKILKVSGIVLVGLIAILLLLGLVAPKDFKVQRSVVIPTKNKQVIFKNISTWSEFLKWNPWSYKDPNQKVTFEGTEGQVGSNYMWEGNDDVGKGQMTITSVKEFERVEQDLHFLEPFETKNKTAFTMSPEGEGYKVSWEMSGHSDFPVNIVGLFMDMDKMVGGDFEKGLNNLKQKCVDEAASVPTVQGN